MKTKLFDSALISSEAIIATLESSNVGVSELTIVRHYSDDELEEIERKYLEGSKQINVLKKKLEELIAPIKEQLKPLQKQAAIDIALINQGGEKVTEKVYCFPDHESHLMGLYDSTSTLVGTREMTKNERQLHINTVSASKIAQD